MSISIQDMVRWNVLITLGEVERVHLFGEHVHAEPTTRQSIPAEPLWKHDFFRLAQHQLGTLLRLVREESDGCRNRVMTNADME